MATNPTDFAAELKEQLDRAKDPQQMAGLAIDLASIIPLDPHTMDELQFDEKMQAEVKKNVEQQAAPAPVEPHEELVFDLGGLSEDGLSLFDVDVPKPAVVKEESKETIVDEPKPAVAKEVSEETVIKAEVTKEASKEALPAALTLAPAPSELIPLVENDALLQKITDLESALEIELENNKVLGQSLNETIDLAQKANQVYQAKEKELQEQIAKFQEQIAKLQEMLSGKDKLLSEKDESIARLNMAFAEKETALAQKANDSLQKDIALAQKEAELAATSQDIQAERERVKKLQSDVKELEEVYQMIEDAENKELESNTNLVAEKKKGQELEEANKFLKETEEKLKSELDGLKSSRASTQILHLGDFSGVPSVRLHYSVDEITVRQGLPIPKTATDLKVTLPLFTTLQSLKADDDGKKRVETKGAKP